MNLKERTAEIKKSLQSSVDRTVDQLGPYSDKLGVKIKRLLESDDWMDLMDLSVALDVCRQRRNWEPMFQA